MENNAYAHLDEMPGSLRAAERIVPVILDVVGPVRSVVDMGGGNGGWLSVFRKHGIDDVFLYDSADVETCLQIPSGRFRPFDLRRDLPSPHRCDLALCLEFAEHMPEERAPALVEWLISSAEKVVFSAAIPQQGGKGHINEQWPRYWKELFENFGFKRYDHLRARIVHDPEIPWWYRQNLFLFASPEAGIATTQDLLPDDMYLVYQRTAEKLSRDASRLSPNSMLRTVKARIRSRLRRSAVVK